eukprot:gb/GECG01007263.1/.p1 GENE.gb/GECG01007263.1/~~gb/GECG01007263.1/.p1  ORF type:complete len:370 (+),score=48.10 gb/GECG01007263.1/:1-1110(+)
MPRIEQEVKLDFKDVMIRPKRSVLSSRSEVQLQRTMPFRNSKREWSGVPIFAANMDTTGTFEIAKELAKKECCTAIHKWYTVDEWLTFAKENKDTLPFVAISAGTGENDEEKLSKVLAAVPELTMICLDVANGYSEHFVKTVQRYRENYPSHTIIAGNVVTGEMVEELIISGADIVKVGIGPGSVCTTRKQTGVGYPQLSAVLECADAAHGLNGHIISDGGCSVPGDIAKALGAGADFVMLGGMLSGHDESGGEFVQRNGKSFKAFYGMSSSTAMKKHAGGVAEYRSSEGKAVEVPYRGPIEGTMLSILGGLRSACTYVGALKLKELPKRTTFIKCSQQTNPSFDQLTHRDTDDHGYTNLSSNKKARKQ